MNGKSIRLARILPFPGNRGCIVPIDHGATYGPITGLEKSYKTVENIIKGGVSAIVLHKGILSNVERYPGLANANYILHVSASTSFGSTQSEKVLVATVEEAIRLGAIGVSVHVNLGVDSEPEMLRDFGIVAGKCYEWGMPLLAMMYTPEGDKKVEGIAHAARLAQEIGADLVKVNYPGSAEAMKEVINGVEIPVMIAGGSRITQLEEFLRVVDEALFGGAAGVSIGRNIFQHKQTRRVTEAICNLLQNKWHLQECIDYVDQGAFHLLR